MTLGDVQVTDRLSAEKIAAQRSWLAGAGNIDYQRGLPELGFENGKNKAKSTENTRITGLNHGSTWVMPVGRVLVLTHGSMVIRRNLPVVRKISPQTPNPISLRCIAPVAPPLVDPSRTRSYAEVVQSAAMDMERRVPSDRRPMQHLMKGAACPQGPMNVRPGSAMGAGVVFGTSAAPVAATSGRVPLSLALVRCRMWACSPVFRRLQALWQADHSPALLMR